MSEDSLIPSVFHEEDQNGVFRKGGLMAGGVLVLITFAVPFDILWDVISLGVILSFNLTNTSLIMLRCGNGGKKVRPLERSECNGDERSEEQETTEDLVLYESMGVGR